MSGIWRRTRKFVYRRILHADDTPHRIALGVGIATFVAFTPTVGFQTLIAVGLAALLGANKAVCLPFVWITNPFTIGIVYWPCWRLGVSLTRNPSGTDHAAVMQALHSYPEAGVGFWEGVFSYEFWVGLAHLMLELGTELWIGCVVVGVVFGGSFYLATKWTVETYRSRREQRMMRKYERHRAAGISTAPANRAKKVAVAGKAV